MKEEVDHHIHLTYSDRLREHSLGGCRELMCLPEPTEAFDLKEPLQKELEDLVGGKEKKKGATAPFFTPSPPLQNLRRESVTS